MGLRGQGGQGSLVLPTLDDFSVQSSLRSSGSTLLQRYPVAYRIGGPRTNCPGHAQARSTESPRAAFHH